MFIDTEKFVREKSRLVGQMPVSGFERLADQLWRAPHEVKTESDVHYELSGGQDSRERSILSLRVSGHLALQCQRCMQALAFALSVDTTVRLVEEALIEQEYSDDPLEWDCIAQSSEMDVAAFIEDEILLSLPAYPRHEDQSDCKMAKVGELGLDEVLDEDLNERSSASKNAFGALKQWRTMDHKEFK